MQEEARRSYHQRLEHKTDRESLEILETFERPKAERMASNDRRSLALLEDATTKLRNKMTHCTPPFQPTLWQRPTRVTASQSTDDKMKTSSKQVDNKRPMSLGQGSGHHSIGSSYAVLSPVRSALDSPRLKHESSPPSHDDRFSINAKEWLEDNLVHESISSKTAEQKITNWLQTISSTTSNDKERADVEIPTSTSDNSSPSTQSLSSLDMEDSEMLAASVHNGDNDAKSASLKSFEVASSSGIDEQNTLSHESERSHVAGLTVHELELTMPNMRGDGSVVDEREDQQAADAGGVEGAEGDEDEEVEDWIVIADELHQAEHETQRSAE